MANRDYLEVIFIDNQIPLNTRSIHMSEPTNSKADRLPKINLNPDQTFDQYVKERLKDGLDLIENPTSDQIKKIVRDRVRRRPGKTVYYQDFIAERAKSVDPDDIIEAEIIAENLKVPLKNIKNNEL